MDDLISRQAAIDELDVSAEFLRRVLDDADIVGVEREKYEWGLGLIESCIFDIKEMPSAQPEQHLLTEDNYVYYAECDPEVKCLSCGHRIAERPFEVYCNIMCKWVNEKYYCTMFEPGQEKIRKTEAQI